MTRKLFLDVGAHSGHTLDEVLKPGYPFDWVVAFEPMPREYALLQRREKPENLIIHNYGLSDCTARVPVYGTNDRLEASIYPTKDDVDSSMVTQCQMVAASEFFDRFVLDGDEVYMKLNCEGAEVPILLDLIETGQIKRVTDVMIDWDIRKVKGEEGGEATVLSRFGEIGFSRYSLCDDVMRGGTHQERIANWLASVGIVRDET